jgi:serine/threonine protein kinase
MEYKYGTTGFVEIDKTVARKHMPIDELYWAKEYTILIYLWGFNHTNIIRHIGGNYLYKIAPNTNKRRKYYELIFPRYPRTLSDAVIYKDSDIVQIMSDLLSATSLCHKLNIWHRDIKPDNVMLTKTNRAVLIDFTHSVRIRTNEICLEKHIATYTHRAPEVFKYMQNSGPEYNEKIDVWALGVLLFEMVTGKQMYQEITDDGSEEEVCDFFNACGNDSLYFKKLYHIYKKNTRTMFWNGYYWKWIKRMLSYNADDRPDASEMLTTISKFATKHKIKYTVSTWKNIQKLEINVYKYTDVLTLSKSKIYKYACSISDIFCMACSMTYNKQKIYSIIRIMVINQNIKLKNVNNMVLSLTLLICAIIYDQIIEIPKSIKMIYHNLGHKIDRQKIHDMMINIMQEYDIDIFLHDKLDFGTDISDNTP